MKRSNFTLIGISKFPKIITLTLIMFLHSLVFAKERPTRLVFTGDVLLSREVQREITLRHGQSPWSKMGDFFKNSDWVMGNLEGSVGETSQCPEDNRSLCFAVPQKLLTLPKKTGFHAFGIENNHSFDLGPDGKKNTRQEILRNGLFAISYNPSPGFFKDKQRIFSFIAFSNVPGRDHEKVEVPSIELRQKIRLAKKFSDWLIVYVHWGNELSDWVHPKQKEMAKWLIDQGADVIIGHHPHVVQPPECIQGRPVYFSLGNHVFDQKYPATKRGLIADCKANENELSCSSVATTTPPNSSFPEVTKDINLKENDIANCKVAKSDPLVVDGYTVRPRLSEHQYVDGEIVIEGNKLGSKLWNVLAKRILSIDKGRFTNDTSKEYLFTLEAHPSSIDKEIGPRPYVYEVSAHGLIAKWRGSALAWPLLDAKLIKSSSVTSNDVDYLCALHRKDSFIVLDPKSKETRTAVYKWNGFGFSGVNDPKLNTECDLVFKPWVNLLRI